MDTMDTQSRIFLPLILSNARSCKALKKEIFIDRCQILKKTY
jgi:hypothetical protein